MGDSPESGGDIENACSEFLKPMAALHPI